jgi:hypothetical protein
LRLAVAELERLVVPMIGCERPARACEASNPWYATVERLAEVCGVSPRAYARYRAEGMSARQADRAAVACGFHPTEVWGPDFWEAA